MPKVKLSRRWGSRQAGSTVEVSEARAAFLKGIGWTDDTVVLSADGVRPGENGPDPIVSGDPTRRRPVIQAQERDESVNRAQAVDGAPDAALRPAATDEPKPARRSRRKAGSSDSDSGTSES